MVLKNVRGITLGDQIPDFHFDSSQGKMTLKEYFNGNWGLLCSHPDDYTPICTTELGELARLDNLGEFSKRKTKVIGLSCNDVASHCGWIQDIKAFSGNTVNYPIIADKSREIACQMGMLSSDDLDKDGLPLTVRSVFVIGPDMSIKLTLTYPASTGRNFVEILRVLDSLQMTAYHACATPVNWVKGDKACIVPSVSNEQAQEMFPKGFEVLELPSGKGYLRFTPDPTT
jgi:1-Cys peroxiredoxin 6